MGRSKKGFSIVELIIVIAVIAVLAAVLIPVSIGLVEKAEYSKDIADAKNMTLALSTNPGINCQADLDDELGANFGSVFVKTIAPRTAKKGYHFWYNLGTKTVELAKTNDLVINDNSFPNPTPRSSIVNGHILLDRTGSEMAKFVTGLETVCSKQECDELLSYGMGLTEDNNERYGINCLYDFLSHLVVINSNGSVRFSDADMISHVYFPNRFASLQSTNIYLYDESSERFNAYKLSEDTPQIGLGMNERNVEIPTTMYLGSNSFFVDPYADVTLVFDLENVEELRTVLAAEATNAKIALKKDLSKKYYIFKNIVKDADTGIDVAENLVYSISEEVLNYRLPSIPAVTKTVTVSTNWLKRTTERVTITTDEGISVIIPAGVKTTSNELTLIITPLPATESNLVLTGSATSSVDVHIDGISADNDIAILVSLGRALPPNLSQSAVKMYHIEKGNPSSMTKVQSVDELNSHNECIYDMNSGDVVVALKSFSEILMQVDPSKAWSNDQKDISWYDSDNTEFTISTAAQLAGLAKLVNEGTDTFEGKTVKLANDIVINDWNIYGHGEYLKDDYGNAYTKENPLPMTPHEIAANNDVVWYDPCRTLESQGLSRETDYYPYYFEPIGNRNHPFMGNFDGQGHTVSGLFDIDCWYDGHSVGLFGYVYGTSQSGSVIKNLNIDDCFVYSEYCRIGLVACNATGKCTFENIACHNNNVASYNEYVGGIVANFWYIKFDGNSAANSVCTMKNCKVDNTNTLSALWGTYDCILGGLIGGLDDDGSKVHFSDCTVYCTLDAYNDCCANYQWFQYRYCGMIIGWAPFSGVGQLKEGIITCEDCVVAVGPWNQYYYYKWPENGKPSYAAEHDWKYSRYTESELVRNDAGEVTGSTVNFQSLIGEKVTSRGVEYTLTAEDVDDRLCYLPLNQLFGSGNGGGTVGRYGVESIDGVKYVDYETLINQGGEPITTGTITKKWTNTNFMYRVGNGNTINLDSLFYQEENSADINLEYFDVTIETIDGAIGTFTKNESAWGNGTIQFEGTGVVKLTLTNYRQSLTYILEVVDAVNATSATSAVNNNVVLLNNILGTFDVKNHTLYGNGFTVTASGKGGAKTFAESMILVENGIIDNTTIIFDVFPKGYMFSKEVANYGQVSHDYMRTGVRLKGNSRLLNSFIKGARAAVHIAEGENVEINNTTISGGTLCNLLISTITGELILKDVTTIQEPLESTYELNGSKIDVLGLGIFCENSTNPQITLQGDLLQYNWVSSGDAQYVPSNYRTAVSVALNQTEFIHKVNGVDYVNLGMIFFNGNELYITDERSNKNTIPYSGDLVSIFGGSGTVYSYNNSNGNVHESRFSLSNYSYEPNKQSVYEPHIVFDHDINHIPKADNDDNYCYYDSSSKRVRVSLKQQDYSDAYSYNPMILNLNKYSHSDYAYSVSVNGTQYNGNISFSETGDYTIIYRFTDAYNYKIIYDNENLSLSTERYSIDYEIELVLNVVIVEPDKIQYHPEFSYVGNWSAYSSTPVVIGNDTYIMPKANSTSPTIGSTTVNGQTVYYPIVTVSGKNSNGGDYTSGKIYCFAPAFSAINIKDLDVNTGETLYTYNSTSQNWPHGIAASNGPSNSAYYGPASTRDPYGAATGAAYEKYAYNSSNGGLCFTSNEIERSITANTKLVKFHYVGNDGTTYYYYIQYKYVAVEYSKGSGGCLAPDTMILMADGTEKQVQYVIPGDELLVFNHETGEIETSFVLFNDIEEEQEFEIINLDFSNGKRVQVISEHGFFDLDLMKYVYIDGDNYEDFVGHRFYGIEGEYTLDRASLTYETMAVYSPVTYSTLNYFTEGMLSMPGGITGLFNIFDYDNDLRYDQAAMNRDIETYGLFTAEEMEGIGVTEIMFNAYNGKYLKIALGKGILTEKHLIYMIERYGGFTE